MGKTINVGTVFSGIGSPEQAIRKLGYETKIIFACDNGEREIKETIEEIRHNIENMSPEQAKKYINAIYASTNKTNYVKKSYMANYGVNEDDWHEDIRFLDGKRYKGQLDLFIGGSPCQSFSIIGKRAGLEDTRGTLFYDFARLVNEIKPKAFIFENVPGMLTHDKGNTWKVILNVFNSLGYKVFYDILNAKDYGVPQDRKRLFVIGFKDKNAKYEFPKPFELTSTMSDYLDEEVNAKHYLGKKGFEFVTNPKYKNRARINPNIIQTQKANQQFNWNGDFVFEPLDKVQHRSDVMARAYVSKWNGQEGVIRQLSYRECLRLMGFAENYDIVVPNVPAYRQIGNSIVVNVLEHIIKEILKVININE